MTVVVDDRSRRSHDEYMYRGAHHSRQAIYKQYNFEFVDTEKEGTTAMEVEGIIRVPLIDGCWRNRSLGRHSALWFSINKSGILLGHSSTDIG